MPLNSRSRLASMTWSMSTNVEGAISMSRGRIWGTLTRAKPALAGLRVAHADRDREAERADVRERVARVDGERGEDREDLVDEALAQALVMVAAPRRSRGSRRPPRPAPRGAP